MTAFLSLTLLLAPDFTNIAEEAGIPDPLVAQTLVATA